MQQVRKLVSKKELKTVYGIPFSFRAHRAPGESRQLPQADTAGRFQGRMVGG